MQQSPALTPQVVAQARQRALADLCARYGLDIVYAFGSRAREAYEWLIGQRDALSSTSSDLDIGVKTINSERMDISKTVDLTLQLEDMFSVKRVDLVHLPQADAFLAANIIRGERLYTRDSIQADEYELYVLRRAGDLAPFKRQQMAMVLGEVA